VFISSLLAISTDKLMRRKLAEASQP